MKTSATVIRPNLKVKMISARDMTALLEIQLLFAPKTGATQQGWPPWGQPYALAGG
jgi:hypothetical protein